MAFFRTFKGILVILLAVWAFEAGAQTDLANEYLKEMNLMADALESVTDDASAQAAAEKMSGALGRLQVLVDDTKTWSDAEKQTFFLQNHNEFIAVQTRMSNALLRMVHNPEYMELFSEQMQKMPKVGQ